MPKSPDERIETLEKKLNLWRILAVLLIVLLFVVTRRTVVGWIDHAENWMGGVANVRAS